MPRFFQEIAGLITGIIKGLVWWIVLYQGLISWSFWYWRGYGGTLRFSWNLCGVMPYFLGHSGAWVLVGSWMGAWWLDLTWFDHTIWKIIPGVFRTQYIPLALYRLINSWSTIIQDQMKNHPLKKHLRNIGSQILPTTYFSPARSITSRPPREKKHTKSPAPDVPRKGGQTSSFFLMIYMGHWWHNGIHPLGGSFQFVPS